MMHGPYASQTMTRGEGAENCAPCDARLSSGALRGALFIPAAAVACRSAAMTPDMGGSRGNWGKVRR